MWLNSLIFINNNGNKCQLITNVYSKYITFLLYIENLSTNSCYSKGQIKLFTSSGGGVSFLD